MHSAAEAFEFDTERWCAGLPFVETQPLTPSEREALERRSARLLAWWWATLAAITALALWPASFALFEGHRLSDAVIVALSLAVAFGWLLGFPMLGIHAHGLWCERARHRADLAADEALVFAGRLDPGQVLDDELRALFRAGVLRPQADAEQTLRVFAASHTIFAVAPGGRARFVRARVAEVATRPGYALRVALPQQTAWLTGEPDVEFLKRALTNEEQAELAAHVERLERPNLAVAFMGMYFVMLIAAPFMPGPRAIVLGGVGYAIQLAIAAVALAFYARALRLAWRLKRDIRTGWALTFHRRAVDALNAAPDPREGTEFLPHSLTVWIEHGRPARWRNLRARS